MAPHQRTAVDVHDILELLRQGTVEIEGMLPYSSNYTLLAAVEHQGLRVLAVYKPRRGERPLWDFPHGTLYQRETAAFVVSEALEFSFVPPTVVRDGPYGIGALQLFIENDFDSHLFTMQHEPGYEHALFQLAAFDYVINNADRKSGHCLKGLDNRLWAIDHGISFHCEYKLRTVLWDFVGQPLPDDISTALRNFQECLSQRQNHVTMALTDLLASNELRALRQRVDSLLACGVYPSPGPGPKVPWPPV